MKSGIVRIVALAALLGLGACTPPMEFPEVAQRPPIEVGRDAGKIAFGRALSKIPLGTQVAAVPNIGGGPRDRHRGCGIGSGIYLHRLCMKPPAPPGK